MPDQQESSQTDKDQTQTESTSEETKFVPVTAYREVSQDMHKFKNRAKEAEARANELEAKFRAAEEAKLKEQNKYQELYEREKQEREKIENERLRDRELYLRSVKVSALKSALGGKVNDQYLSFANIDKIELKEDGTLNSDSVQAVANAFRQDHPGLIAKDSAVNITGSAPANGIVTEQPAKSLKEMTMEQKIALLEQIKQKNRS